jgi:hypothetical protein
MPVVYRTHVAPRFARWIADGYRRWKDHPAMQAGRELAQRCLAFTYEPAADGIRVADWTATAHIMAALRRHGVTPEQLMLRTAEMAALFDAEPSRCPTRLMEEMALGRAVVHLVPWQGAGRGQGKRMTLAVARHLVDKGLVGWANAFVQQLNADQQRDAELARRAATFD